jgi:parvulin-like peptidyl-prolyl isomerase
MTDVNSTQAVTEAAPAPLRQGPGSGFLRASQVHTLRSMVLFALGALTGLAIAGYGLFTAQGTATRTVPPEDLALVNQRPILRSDFVTQLEAETGMAFDEASRKDKLKVLDEMVTEELLVQRGLELDFAETDQDTRNALVSVVNQQMAAEIMTSQPTDEVLKKYYDEHRADYATEGILNVRNLLVPKSAGGSQEELLARAREVAQALRANTPVETVMARFGLSEPSKDDDDFYFAARIHLGEKMFANVVRLAPGTVSEPLPAADGIHVVKVTKNIAPVPSSFADSRQQVMNDYKTAQQKRLTEATLKFLRGRARILIATDYANDYKP